MKSMTGYGFAEKKCDSSFSVSAELHSVNKKNLDVKIIIPQDLLRLEMRLRKIIPSGISRGMVTLRISQIWNGSDDCAPPKINVKVFGYYYRKLEELREKFGIKTETRISDILSAPGIFGETFSGCGQKMDDMICEVVSDAMDKFVKMRENEGAELKKDIDERISKLFDILAEIEAKTLSNAEEQKKNLLARIKKSGSDLEKLEKPLAETAGQLECQC
jgi:uncharacterized protein (TIGR00255 family)